MFDERLKPFLISILHEAHGPYLANVLQEEMLADLYIQLEYHLEEVILEHLPEEHHVSYYAYSNQVNGHEALHALMAEHVPNIGDIVAQALEAFKQDYVQFTGSIN